MSINVIARLMGICIHPINTWSSQPSTVKDFFKTKVATKIEEQPSCSRKTKKQTQNVSKKVESDMGLAWKEWNLYCKADEVNIHFACNSIVINIGPHLFIFIGSSLESDWRIWPNHPRNAWKRTSCLFNQVLMRNPFCIVLLCCFVLTT